MATPVFKEFAANVEASTAKAQASLDKLNKEMATQTKLVSDMAKEQVTASDEVVAANSAQVRSVDELAAAHVAAAEKVKAANDAEVSSTVAAADAQVAAADKKVASFGVAGSGLSTFGKYAAETLLSVGAGTIDMASKFQSNTLRMQTQAGATSSQLDKIRLGLLAMADQVGATPNQLANGMYHVVSSMNAVIPPSQRVSVELNIMKAAAEGAQVGHSNLEDTTYALASAMNALHDSTGNAGKIMGELNAIVGSGDMTMQDLIDSFKSGLIPSANEFGISLQSVGAALAVMGDMGMRGALAGTRLRMAISLLGAPTDQAAHILESLGLSSTQAITQQASFAAALTKAGVNVTMLSQDLRKPDGLQVALADLNTHLRNAGLSGDGAAATISRAFGGGRMGAAISLMAENTDRLGLKFDYIGQKASNFGTDWTLTSHSFRVEVDKAVASIESMGISIGNFLLPYATKGLQAIEAMAHWLQQNKIVLDSLGLAVGTFATVAIGSYLISKLKTAIGLIKDLGSGMAGAGRWLLGINPAGGTPAGGGGVGGGLGGAGGALGGMVGYMGSPIKMGMMSNPIAVTLSSVGVGMGGSAATAAENALQTESRTPGGIPTLGAAGSEAKSVSAMSQQATAMASTASSLEMAQAAAERQTASLAQIAAEHQALGLTAPTATEMQQMNLENIPPAGAASLAEVKAAEAAATQTPFITTLPNPAAAGTQEQRLRAAMVAQAEQDAQMQIAQIDAQTAASKALPMTQGMDLFSQGSMLPAAEMGAAGAGSQLSLFGATTSAETRAAITATEASIAPSLLSDIKGAFTGGGLKSALSSGLSSLMKGGMIAGGGILGSQLIGSAIGGTPGKDVSTIGTYASVGAGLGSFFGPEGTFAGAVLGGLGGAFEIFVNKDATKYGDQIASKVTAPMGVAIAAQFNKPIADAINKAKQDSTQAVVQANLVASQATRNPLERGRVPGSVLPSSAATAAEAAAAAAAYDTAGIKAGQAFETAFNQVKVKTQPAFISDALMTLQSLPPQARDSASATIIQYAAGLAAQKKLPLDAVDQIISGLESRYGALSPYIANQGDQNAATITATMKWDGAVTNLVTSENAIRTTFGLWKTDPTINGANVVTAYDSEMAQLKAISQQRIGVEAHDQVVAAMTSLRTDAGTVMDNMVQDFTTKTAAISNILSQGPAGANWASAVKQATSNFSNLTSSIGQLMAGGATSTATGAKSIYDSIVAIMKSVGGKAPSAPAIGVASVESSVLAPISSIVSTISGGSVPVGTGVGSPGGLASPHAIGGKVHSPTIMVGEEGPSHPEYVLATNPAYRPRNVGLWAQYAKEIGIPGFAQGGTTGSSPYIDPIPGFSIGRTDMGVDASAAPGTPILAIGDSKLVDVIPNWYSGQPLLDFQLQNGIDAGKFWYVAEQILPVTEQIGAMFKAGQAVAHYAPTGTGIEIGWAANAAGTTLAAATTGYTEGQVTTAGSSFNTFLSGLAQGKIVSGGGIAQASQSIKAPQVTGGGLIGTIAQDAMNIMTKAANAYITANAIGTTGGAGANVGSLVPGIMAIEQQAAQIAGLAFVPTIVAQLLSKESSGGVNEPPSGSLNATGPNQVIPSTFATYEIPGHTNINNPLDNAIASMRYIKSRYGSLAAMAATTGLFGSGYVGYAQGGRIANAGAFAQGGAFTTQGPTTALFGENGQETVLAIPNSMIHQGMASHNADFTGDITYPGEPAGLTGFAAYWWKVKHGYPAGSTGQTAGGAPLPASAGGTSAAPSSSTSTTSTTTKATTPPKKSYHYDPVSGTIVLATATEWNKIAVENAKYRAQAAAQKKAQDAYLATQVQDLLKIGGMPAGLIEESRKSFGAENMPAGGTFQLNSADLKKVTEAGFTKIASALDKQLKVDTTDQLIDMAGKMGERVGKNVTSRVNQVETKIITSALTSVTTDFTNQQTQFTHDVNIEQLLGKVAPGTNLSTLGLSKMQLKASGLTKSSAQAMIGTGPAADLAAIQELSNKEIPQYQADAKHVQDLYHDALKDHNKKLQESLLKQLDAITQAQIQANADLQTAQVQQIQDQAKTFQDQADASKGQGDILTAIADLAPGESLSTMGLTPAILAAMGISTTQAAAVQGGGTNYLQGLESQQGGTLTPSQIGQAQSSAAAQNAVLQQQQQQLAGELAYYQSALPSLSGSNKQSAVTAMLSLAQQIASLQGSMDSNTNAVDNLTQATNQNTSATGQMTGSVGYTYQGQNYLAGPGLTGDQTINLGLQ